MKRLFSTFAATLPTLFRCNTMERKLLPHKQQI